jgi:hypothetical protein
MQKLALAFSDNSNCRLGRAGFRSTVPVEFVYQTSFPDGPPKGTNAKLRGSWDGAS